MMQIDEFLSLVKSRRSCRKFKPDLIPDESIKKVIEAARWAMSGANGQPWEFIIVKDKQTIHKIAELDRDAKMETYYMELTRVSELRHPSQRHPPDISGFKDAPVLIVVVGDRRTFQASVLSSNFLAGEAGAGATYVQGLANATFSLCLAAAALGLGSQWVSVTSALEQPLKRLLDVPDVLGIRTIVPLGYPASEPKPSYRREFDEIVHYERYDRNKYRSGKDIVEFIKRLRERTTPTYSATS
ncbi:MAG: nitroreductase family protein [Chloroflexi bacterium]|nr:nitroreductase family protein [Chloroflexota bacterium]